MTCCVAIKAGNNTYLGGDSAVSFGGGHMDTLARPKVFKKDKDLLIGCAGALRVLQVVEHSLKIPSHRIGMSNYEYCAKTLVSEVQTCFESNDVSSNNSVLLVGYRDSIFQIYTSDYSTIEIDTDYATIGSGASYAEGSLHSTVGNSPESRIRDALSAAAKYNNAVAPPFYCINFKSKKAYKI